MDMLIFVVAFAAFSLSAACGGGAGLLLMPLLGSVLPAAQVPAALSLGTSTSAVSRIILFRRHIRWDIVRWFMPASLPAVWFGAYSLSRLSPVYIELFIGIFLLMNLPQFLKRSQCDEINVRPLPKFYLIGIGAAAGFLSGMTGAVGLLFNRFYLRYGMSKENIIATRAANELMLHLIKLVLYAALGLLSVRALELGLIVAAAAIAASLSVIWWLPKMSESLFRRLGYGAMVMAGVLIMNDAGAHLMRDHALNITHQVLENGAEASLEGHDIRTITLEFKYDEGFEVEQRIELASLPPDKQVRVKKLSDHAESIIIEEVFGIGKRSYELYCFKKGKLTAKYDL